MVQNETVSGRMCLEMLLDIVCSTDAILIPSPFYGVITEDVGLYSSVKLHHVPLYSQVVSESPVVIFHNVTLAFYSVFLLFYFCFLKLYILYFCLYLYCVGTAHRK